VAAGPEENPVVIRLAGGYPRRQLDRLLGQLEPVLSLQEPAVLRLDLEGLVFLGPTAQAVVAAAFHRVITDGLALTGSTVTVPRAAMVYRYLQRMDFFEPITGALPEEFERHEPTGFRPLQHYESSGSCYSTARELKDALTEACQLDERYASAAIHVCLAELAENVLFHADAPYGGFAAAQGWQSRSEVEVAIVDMGVGIRASLTKNAAYADIAEDVEAIEKALDPMVTATPNRNTGLGLSLTRFLLRRNGGQLMVRSGEGAVYAGSTEKSEICTAPFPGTIVTLMARTDAPLDINGAYDDLYAAGYRPNDES
jgi:hypothetical protein